MKKTFMRGKFVTVIAMLVVLTGCATGMEVETDQLHTGMTAKEVTTLLGEPASSQYVDGYMIWKYSLERPRAGLIPYYLAFDGYTMRLAGWREDIQGSFAWLQTLSRQQHNLDADRTTN